MSWEVSIERPFDWRELRDLATGRGFRFDRYRGDHYVMTKPRASRPVVIPMKNQLKERIVLSVARTIGMDRVDLEKYIRSRKGRRGC